MKPSALFQPWAPGWRWRWGWPRRRDSRVAGRGWVGDGDRVDVLVDGLVDVPVDVDDDDRGVIFASNKYSMPRIFRDFPFLGIALRWRKFLLFRGEIVVQIISMKNLSRSFSYFLRSMPSLGSIRRWVDWVSPYGLALKCRFKAQLPCSDQWNKTSFLQSTFYSKSSETWLDWALPASMQE